MNPRRYVTVAIGVALGIGCTDPATAPDRATAASDIDRLQIFVRDWPDEYVEIDFQRKAGERTLVVFRPAQPGLPRVLLDSIGPTKEDPKEIADLLKSFDVWALADSNAAGAACNTRSGQWSCNPTFNDYSLVMAVTRDGVVRAQRYTRLEESTSSKTARALGDFVFAMARKRQPPLQTGSATQVVQHGNAPARERAVRTNR
jgi:hypothetical protein